MKLLKLLFGTLVAILVAIGIFIATFDPNAYREEITQTVKQQTGRDLDFESIELSLYPHFGLSLKQTRLSNPQGFETPDFLKVSEVQIGLDILPLLQSQLQLDALVLHDLEVYLHQKNAELNNWQDLAGEASTNNEAQEETVDSHTPEQKDPAEVLQQLAALSFGGLDIQNAKLVYRDDTQGQRIEINQLNLQTSEIELDEFFEVSLQVTTKLAKPQLENKLAASIQIKVNSDLTFALKDLVLQDELNSQALPVGQVVADLSIPVIDLNPEKQTLKLPETLLKYRVAKGNGIPVKTVEGELSLKDIQAQLQAQTVSLEDLAMTNYVETVGLPTEQVTSTLFLQNIQLDGIKQKLDAGTLKLDAQAKGAELPFGQVHAKLALQPSVDMSQGVASLKDIKLTALDLNLQADVSAKQLNDKPKAEVGIKLSEFNIRKLLQALAIELPPMANQQSLQKVALETNLQVDMATDSLEVNQLAFILDHSKLQGNTSVANFSQPAVRFDLALDQIKVDDYLPPPVEAPQPAPEPDPNAPELEIILPNELIRSLDIEGQLKVGSLQFQKFNPTKTLLKVKAYQGEVVLAPFETHIFETDVKAQAKLDVRGDTPIYAVKALVPQLPIDQALLAVLDDAMVSGKGSVDADITTQGTKISHFKQNLNGDLAMKLKDGAVKGFNLAQSIRDAKASLSGGKADTASDPQTDFSELEAAFNIKQGVVNTKYLRAHAPFMRVEGEGQVDLVKENLDMLLMSKIVGSDKGQGGQELADLSGIPLPVKLKGPWTQPDVSLELGKLMEEKAKAEIEAKKAAIKAELEAKKKALKAELDRKKREAEQKLQADLEAKKRAAEEKARAEIKAKEQELKQNLENQLQDALKGFKF